MKKGWTSNDKTGKKISNHLLLIVFLAKKYNKNVVTMTHTDNKDNADVAMLKVVTLAIYAVNK